MSSAVENLEPSAPPTVFIIDDDPGVRQGLRARIESESYRTEVFASAERFLEDYVNSDSGCIVTDLYLHRLTGIELLRQLRSSGCELPVILISGLADVTSAVEGMKLGAVDFLQKPVQPGALMDAIHKALARAQSSRQQIDKMRAVKERFQSLSSRELMVLDHVVRGESSKQIAHNLGISIKTVSHHRASIIAKAGALNTADVVRLAQMAEVCPLPTQAALAS